jgi:phosphocarrier protein
MGVLMLAAAQGSSITLITEGQDAQEAIDALAELVANRFDEEA